jgi:hypothetical protein
MTKPLDSWGRRLQFSLDRRLGGPEEQSSPEKNTTISADNQTAVTIFLMLMYALIPYVQTLRLCGTN